MQKLKQLFYYLFIENTLKSIVGVIVVSCVIVFSLRVTSKHAKETQLINNQVFYENDLKEILKKGKLTVLVENSSVSFFVYRGKKMGFEYEILKEFANEIGVDLEVKIIDDLDNAIDQLNNGEGDLLACNFTVSKERAKVIDFSIPVFKTNQVLVQRKPDGWSSLKPKEYQQQIIHDAGHLAGKKVHVWKNSSFSQRLKHLQEEIGDTIYITEESGSLGVEEMIEMVSEGLIDYTVSDVNLAKINSRFYSNIDISLNLSVKQKIAFGIRKSSPILKARLDHWLEKFKHKTAFKYIKYKYFELAPISSGSNKLFSSLKGGKISVFDHYFKAAELKSDWDWRLIASICYQESKFNPNIVSFGGAYSMMQFMPEIGPLYGVYVDSPPEVQIMGGARKLKKDFDSWTEIPDKLQRQKFTVATYNSGKSHIIDARKLAEKHGLDPNVWDDNVEKMILNLSKKEYYRDPVVKSGAAKGIVTHRYVREIFARYEMWSSLYK